MLSVGGQPGIAFVAGRVQIAERLGGRERLVEGPAPGDEEIGGRGRASVDRRPAIDAGVAPPPIGRRREEQRQAVVGQEPVHGAAIRIGQLRDQRRRPEGRAARRRGAR